MAIRGFGRTAGILAALISFLAMSGWIQTGYHERLAGEAIVQELETMQALADGLMEERGRLWVITLRGPNGMLRWSGTSAEEAAAWAAAAISDVPGELDWFVNVQGALSAASLDAVWECIERETGGHAVERYEDVTTFSYSYASPKFRHTLSSGDQEIGLQAASHLDTETARWRLTLGTTAILIEY